MKKIYSDEMIKTVMEERQAGLTRAEISEKYAIPIGSYYYKRTKARKRGSGGKDKVLPSLQNKN